MKVVLTGHSTCSLESIDFETCVLPLLSLPGYIHAPWSVSTRTALVMTASGHRPRLQMSSQGLIHRQPSNLNSLTRTITAVTVLERQSSSRLNNLTSYPPAKY